MANIVVVDDSHYLATQIAKFLERAGHVVVGIGADGNEGVALYKEHGPDLVLLDITMPVKDGRVCLEEILESDPRARVLMVSAVKEPGAIMECLQSGARGFVAKPLRFSSETFRHGFEEAVTDALAA